MWKVEERAGNLWRVVNGTRVWGANKGCTEDEARAIATILNITEKFGHSYFELFSETLGDVDAYLA